MISNELNKNMTKKSMQKPKKKYFYSLERKPLFEAPSKSLFIVFDSLDGAGNSTQVKMLADYLKSRGLKAHITKEPTSGLIGGLIKSQLTHDWQSSPECLQLLFSADRAYHLEKEIVPLLQKGVSVVCDRYFFSTMAYGNLGIKDLDWLIEVNKKFLFPDLAIFLKVPARVCIERIESDRFEITLFEKEKILQQVWQNYEKIAKKFKNIHIVDGEQSIEKISEQIIKIVETKLL
jgi:dTMP kinase